MDCNNGSNFTEPKFQFSDRTQRHREAASDEHDYGCNNAEFQERSHSFGLGPTTGSDRGMALVTMQMLLPSMVSNVRLPVA